jgi:uncharacterized protein (TIGR00730 family)
MNRIDKRLAEYQRVLSMDSWRVFRILSEFVEGFETLTDLGPSVTLFGSARTKVGTTDYELAIEVSRRLSKEGFAIITGGGPGIMEAANKGAQLANGPSCGLCIDLPYEHESNGFIDPHLLLNFRYFFVRKVMFIRYAKAVIVLPGGLGTLDELFEVLTLIQTKKIATFPIFLMGSEYWTGLIKWLKDVALAQGNIDEIDLDLFTITDDPFRVVHDIKVHYLKTQALTNF